MALPYPPNPRSGHRVIDADRSKDGLVVTFDDGRAAVFDAEWLYEQIPHAQMVVEPDEAESALPEP